MVKLPLETNEGSQSKKNDVNYRSVFGSLSFLTNSIRPKAQFSVHQYAQFSANTKLLHDQAVKWVLKYLKGVDMQLLIIKPDPEKGVELYVDNDFGGECNQEEGKYPGLVLSRTVYVITYANCPIIWVSQNQT